MNDKIKAIAEKIILRGMEFDFKDQASKEAAYNTMLTIISEAAQAGYDLAKSESEWVSVDDRLPEQSEKAIVLLADGTLLMGEMGAYIWGVYYADGILQEHPSRPITHWMPLPEPPNH